MGSMSDKDLLLVERCVVHAARLWKNLMPTVPMKVHAWQHMLEDLHQFRGLLSHNEQGIEREHQRAKGHAKRVACIRDFEKKTENILRQNATASAPDVVAMQQDTEAKRRKRKNKLATGESTEQRLKYLKDVVNLPEIQEDIPLLIDLEKESLKKCTP